jgi:Uma2 family endonuclease
MPPDWICEVLSPSTAALDRVKKLAVYAREQVPYAWLLDPIVQTLEVLQLEHGRWTILQTSAGRDVVRVPPFEAIEIDLAVLWDLPPAPAGE